MKIVKGSDPITVANITVLIYGNPGLGKTSLAFTAEDALLLDFDKGAYRSGFRKDTVQIEAWSEVESLSAADLAPYKTIAVDTVGRLLDALTVDIIRKNPKMQGFGGALSLQGYGALKAAYATWLKTLLSMGKDVILLAHDREDKNGDDLIIRPDIQGGSYGEVFKRSDGIAYLYRSGKQTILDFSPTDKWVGKNAAGFDPLPVPNFHQKADYFAGVIADIKAALNHMSEEAQKIVSLVADWKVNIDEAADAEQVNKLIAECAKLEAPAGPQVKQLIVDRAKVLGLVWEGKKGAGQYIAKAEAAA